MKTTIGRKSMLLVCVLAIGALSSVVLFDRTSRTAFHGDESGWISTSYYYTDLLVRHDFAWDKWDCLECGDWGGWLTMPLGKLLIGIPLKMNAHTANKPYFEFYWWDRSWEFNLSTGRVPPQDILWPARRVSAIFGLLACIFVFGIGYYCGNWLIGLLAVVLLLTNRLFVESATRAMTDVHYNMFLLSLCLTVAWLSRSANKTRVMLLCCLCGCLTGLAGSVKESGLVLGGMFFLLAILYKDILLKVTKKEIALHLISFSIVAIVVVYVLNPYFWPSFEKLDAGALAQELGVLSNQVMMGTLHKENIALQYPQLSNLGNVSRLILMFVNRREYMITEPTYGQWDGGRLATLHRKLFFDFSSFPLEWVFLGIGIVGFSLKALAAAKNARVALQIVPLFYFLVNYLFILVFMMLNWDRYLIPPVTAGAIVAAGGIYETVARIYGLIVSREASCA